MSASVDLVAELDERAAGYAGLGAAAAGRRRAALFAGFAERGLPEAGVDYVVEALTTELNPEVVAGAAIATHGLADARPEIAAALVQALSNLRGRDAPVLLAGRKSTALLEVLRALRRRPQLDHETVGALADLVKQHAHTWNPAVRTAADRTVDAARATCRRPALLVLQPDGPAVPREPSASPGNATLSAIEVEDQEHRRQPLTAFLSRAPTVVGFFYTRCQNPQKCSLTITKLGDLRRRLDAAGASAVQIAAISYDPGFDTSDRLAAYAAARSLVPDDRTRLFRAVEHQDLLASWFGLRVGYTGSLVNQHAVELYLVAPDLSFSKVWARRPWSVEEVAASSEEIGREMTATGRSQA